MSETLQVRMPREALDRFEAACASIDSAAGIRVSRSGLIRKAIMDWIEKQERAESRKKAS